VCPVYNSDFLRLEVIYSERELICIVAYNQLVFEKIDGFSSNVEAKEVMDGCFSSGVPDENTFIPPAAEEHVGVLSAPLHTKDFIAVCSQMALFSVLGFSFIHVADFDMSVVAGDEVLSSIWVDFGSIEELVHLFGKEKLSWGGMPVLEGSVGVGCEDGVFEVGSIWVQGYARDWGFVTALQKILIAAWMLEWKVPLLEAITLIDPFSMPRAIKLSSVRYAIEETDY
jgi:hypothetical protein